MKLHEMEEERVKEYTLLSEEEVEAILRKVENRSANPIRFKNGEVELLKEGDLEIPGEEEDEEYNLTNALLLLADCQEMFEKLTDPRKKRMIPLASLNKALRLSEEVFAFLHAFDMEEEKDFRDRGSLEVMGSITDWDNEGGSFLKD